MPQQAGGESGSNPNQGPRRPETHGLREPIPLFGEDGEPAPFNLRIPSGEWGAERTIEVGAYTVPYKPKNHSFYLASQVLIPGALDPRQLAALVGEPYTIPGRLLEAMKRDDAALSIIETKGLHHPIVYSLLYGIDPDNPNVSESTIEPSLEERTNIYHSLRMILMPGGQHIRFASAPDASVVQPPDRETGAIFLNFMGFVPIDITPDIIAPAQFWADDPQSGRSVPAIMPHNNIPGFPLLLNAPQLRDASVAFVWLGQE